MGGAVILLWLIDRHTHIRDNLKDGELLEGTKFLNNIYLQDTYEQRIRNASRKAQGSMREAYQTGVQYQNKFDLRPLQNKKIKGCPEASRAIIHERLGRSISPYRIYDQESRGVSIRYMQFYALPAPDHIKVWNDKEVPPIPDEPPKYDPFEWRGREWFKH